MSIKLIKSTTDKRNTSDSILQTVGMHNLNDSGKGAAPPVGKGQGHDGHGHDDAIGVAEGEGEGQHGHHFDSLRSDELCETRLWLLALLGARVEVSVIGGNAKARKGAERE